MIWSSFLFQLGRHVRNLDLTVMRHLFSFCVMCCCIGFITLFISLFLVFSTFLLGQMYAVQKLMIVGDPTFTVDNARILYVNVDL